jgi:putative ABC transport system permease protein
MAVGHAIAIAAGLLIGVATTPLLEPRAFRPAAGGSGGGDRREGAAARRRLWRADRADLRRAAADPRARLPAMALVRARVSPCARWRAALRTMGLPVGLGLAGIATLAIATAQKELAAGFLGGAAALLGCWRRWGWAWRGWPRACRVRAGRSRMALANLHRPGAQTGALVVALGFGLSAFVLLAAVETSLDANIARACPIARPITSCSTCRAMASPGSKRWCAPRPVRRSAPSRCAARSSPMARKTGWCAWPISRNCPRTPGRCAATGA